MNQTEWKQKPVQ